MFVQARRIHDTAEKEAKGEDDSSSTTEVAIDVHDLMRFRISNPSGGAGIQRGKTCASAAIVDRQ